MAGAEVYVWRPITCTVEDADGKTLFKPTIVSHAFTHSTHATVRATVLAAVIAHGKKSAAAASDEMKIKMLKAVTNLEGALGEEE